MNKLLVDSLSTYWSVSTVAINISVFLNILGALLLGLLVGYERSYHGRAAGMRTYGLVCMASAGLTVIAGYPGFWYGGQGVLGSNPDPTRVIQGIVTGVGFLGTGVIMKEGFSISGLTTAASIWASSAIGIMVGVGFYPAAILLAVLSTMCMTLVSKIEGWLPSRHALDIQLRFKKDFVPSEDVVRQMTLNCGYEIAGGSISIALQDGKPEWHFVAIALSKQLAVPIGKWARELTLLDGMENYHLSHARN